MEKLQLSCPECGARLRVPEGAASRVLKCPACGAAIPDWSERASAEAQAGPPVELKPMGTLAFLAGSAADAVARSVLHVGYGVKRLGERRSAAMKVLLCLVPTFTAFLVAFCVFVFRPWFIFVSAGSLAAGLLYLVVNVVVHFAVPSSGRISALLNRLDARQQRRRRAVALAREIEEREREEQPVEEVQAEEGAPAPAEAAAVAERAPAYPALRVLSTVYGAFAWLALFVGGGALVVGLAWSAVRFVQAIAGGEEVSFLAFAAAATVAGVGLLTVLGGLLLLAISELLGLLPDIRTDSWRASQLLDQVRSALERRRRAEAEGDPGE